MEKQAWIVEAEQFIGLKEVVGPKHNPKIQEWLKELGAWWSDDETPWCGVFVAYCIHKAGFTLPQYWMRAKEWANWGVRLEKPVPGCIAVLERQGGGHVFFVTGITSGGFIVGLGGNQGNAVSVTKFDPTRVVAFVYPEGIELPTEDLPINNLSGNSSTNEA